MINCFIDQNRLLNESVFIKTETFRLIFLIYNFLNPQFYGI